MKSERPRRRHKVLAWIAGALLVAIPAIVLTVLILTKKAAVRREARSRAAVARAGPRVQAVRVTRSPPVAELTLQGEVRPWAEATLYAKTSGYLRDLHVDKGDRVRAGERIARIESPETDRLFQQAVADAQNKRDIARRYDTLFKRGLVAAQEAEQVRATARIAEHEVQRQRVLRGYEWIRAPFDGVVTARYVDPGALIQNAAGSASGTQPVIQIAEARTLRVFVYVDQRDAERVEPGDPAMLVFPERANQHVGARVTRLAGALDPATRMRLVEIDIENPGGVVPGGLVEVHLRVDRPSFPRVPSAALVARGGRTFVAVIGDDARVHFRPVAVIADDGQTAQLRAGVEEGESVAVGLGERVQEGTRVQPVFANERG